MKHTHDKLSSLLTLCVFTLFAACVLGVLLTGARVYRTITERDAQLYHQRTADQYVATRLRQAEDGAAIQAMELGGVSVLALREQIDGDRYVTYVYCYDGFLRELFVSEGYAFSPADGERLIAMKQADFYETQNQLVAELTDESGYVVRLVFAMRTGEVLP